MQHPVIPNRWSLEVTAAPGSTAITHDEAKTQGRIYTADDDTYIDTLIQAATPVIEGHLGKVLITQTQVLRLDRWPVRRLEIQLPNPPLRSIASITYVDTAGVTRTLDPSLYTVDIKSIPGRVRPAYGTSWPAIRWVPASIVITFDAGYGAAAAVPEGIKAGMKQLVTDLFENREMSAGHALQGAVLDLLANYRNVTDLDFE